jgi:ataxin-3
MVLAQLQQEGYAIFIVRGVLPECEADHLLLERPAVQTVKPRLISDNRTSSRTSQDEDEEFQLALRMSREEELTDLEHTHVGAALRSSKGDSPSMPQVIAPSTPDLDELRNRRLAFLDRRVENGEVTVGTNTGHKPLDEMTEEEMLEAAMKLSMDPL